MRIRTTATVIVMPDDSQLEATYYCLNTHLNNIERERFTQLFIQLNDCICTLKIEKAICNEPGQLEKIVHNKVLSTKEYLC